MIMKIQTSLLRIGKKNLNGRIYPKRTVNGMIKQFNERFNKNGAFYGELGYSDTFDISLNKVSHNVEAMWIDGDIVMGKVKFLNTKNGRKLKRMHDNGEVVFRSRAAGTIDAKGKVQINKLFAFDAILKADDVFKNLL